MGHSLVKLGHLFYKLHTILVNQKVQILEQKKDSLQHIELQNFMIKYINICTGYSCWVIYFRVCMLKLVPYVS